MQSNQLWPVDEEDLPWPFDIILVRGATFGSRVLCSMQRPFVKHKVMFSHVMITLSIGSCLHSTKTKNKKGVVADRLLDVWDMEEYEEKKLVLRYKKFSDPICTATTAYKQAITEYGKRYNAAFGINKRLVNRLTTEESWFCSEIAAHMLESVLGKGILGIKPEKVYPGHFEKWSVTNDWMDVTDKYGSFIRLLKQGRDPSCSDALARIYYKMYEADLITSIPILQKIEETFHSIMRR